MCGHTTVDFPGHGCLMPLACDSNCPPQIPDCPNPDLFLSLDPFVTKRYLPLLHIAASYLRCVKTAAFHQLPNLFPLTLMYRWILSLLCLTSHQITLLPHTSGA